MQMLYFRTTVINKCISTSTPVRKSWAREPMETYTSLRMRMVRNTPWRSCLSKRLKRNSACDSTLRGKSSAWNNWILPTSSNSSKARKTTKISILCSNIAKVGISFNTNLESIKIITWSSPLIEPLKSCLKSSQGLKIFIKRDISTETSKPKMFSSLKLMEKKYL